MSEPRVISYGDAALLVIVGDRVDERLNDQVHRLDRLVGRQCRREDGWGRAVPSYASLLVPYDPIRLDASEAASQLAAVVAADETSTGGPSADDVPLVEIPVRYGGADGPDLAAVAAAVGRAPHEVVALHSETAYRVFMLGFSPGFPYLGLLPEALRLPRRTEIRPRVPAGSVAIAGEQTGVYPIEGPGGWHLIGRTELVLWDPGRDPPALLRPGQQVRFVPTSGAD